MVDSIKDIINNLPESEANERLDEFMQDEEYISGCQSIINEALEEGFDVIHMENGDIITTGTKVIVTQYRFDPESKKMVKVMSKQKDK